MIRIVVIRVLCYDLYNCMSEPRDPTKKVINIPAIEVERERESLECGDRSVELTAANKSDDWRCVSCGGVNFAREIEYIVGIKEAPWPSSNGNYSAIGECPHCYEKSWIHISPRGASNFKDLIMDIK